MSLKIKWLHFLTILLLLMSLIACQDANQLKEHQYQNISYLFSSAKLKTNSQTFEQVLANDLGHLFFKPRKSYGVGNTNDTYWFKTHLSHRHLSTEDQLIEIPFALLDQCEIWFVDNQTGLVTYYKVGAKYLFKNRPVKSNRFVFNIPKNESKDMEIVIAINTASIVNFSPMLWSKNAWEKNQSNQKTWYGLMLGAIVMLILYNLSLSLALSDISYLYYILYLTGITLYNATSAGLMDQFVWPNVGDLASRSALFLIAFSSLFNFLFINHFLKVKELFPRAWKLSIVMIIIVVPASLPELFGFTQLGLLNNFFILIVIMISFVGIILYLVLAVAAYKQGLKHARFFILAFCVFIASYLLYQFYSFQILEYDPLLIHALEFGTLAEGIILTLALADRINILATRKKAAEQFALATNKSFTRKFIRAQEKEKAKFSSALHDSIGHGLLVLKQNLESIQKSCHLNQKGWKEQKNHSLVQQVDSCESILIELKNMSQELHPSILKELGLEKSIESTYIKALKSLAITYDINISSLPKKMEIDKQITIYRVLQECLNNVIKHSYASHVILNIKIIDSSIQVEISDDGVGITKTKDAKRGIGLTTMAGRIEIYDGRFDIRSSTAGGTKVLFSLPIDQPLSLKKNEIKVGKIHDGINS